MDRDASFQSRKDYSLLFADIHGFSKLKPFQQRVYLKEVLGRVAQALNRPEHRPEQANTWGDGVVAFFSSHTSAIRAALTLRDTFRVATWEDLGLPALKIRISVHSGEVFVGVNPVTGREELIGTEVNRAARIEPIVEPNHVYVTSDFVNRFKGEDVRFQPLGRIALPKDWGDEELFVAGWAFETIDPKELEVSKTKFSLADLQNISQYSRPSKFARRMLVSTQAKSVIASYCVRSKFWRPDDTVFVESGTLPVYMVFELYRACDPMTRPKLLITNSLASSVVAMLGERSRGETYEVFPDDLPTNTILIGGRILDDYAATIPEDLDAGEDGGYWRSSELGKYLKTKGVNHVVMMVTRLSSDDGPCAASSQMRRFKKLLLAYAAETEGVCLSILCEAEKLTGRRGWPADTVDVPGADGAYWPSILRSGRARVIAAVSPGMSEAEIGLAKREMQALTKLGAKCVLLSSSGTEMAFGDGRA